MLGRCKETVFHLYMAHLIRLWRHNSFTTTFDCKELIWENNSLKWCYIFFRYNAPAPISLRTAVSSLCYRILFKSSRNVSRVRVSTRVVIWLEARVMCPIFFPDILVVRLLLVPSCTSERLSVLCGSTLCLDFFVNQTTREIWSTFRSTAWYYSYNSRISHLTGLFAVFT
jgi:hypothetical protein